ncbi:MAG TPA: fibronectin type III domain-containing protein [Thermoanaerobaculia bacterium]|nr:fibronectin type III domain-containing protein [Thermoanaerobaculia bacterium]
MGARLRLKAGTDISMHPPYIQKIFRAFKKYGLIVADNGSNMYISSVYDTRWSNDELNPAFRSLRATDFEVVQRGWAPPVSLVLTIPQTLGSGDPADATVTVRDVNDNIVTAYSGTIHFTSTDGAATLPLDYTFMPGDGGTRAFPNGFILRTAGSQVITVTDVSDATITGSRGVTVEPPAPAALIATATSLTSASLTWDPSAGATQYEVVRNGATIATTMAASYADAALTPGTTYVYRVRAIDSASRPSPLSASDAATTIAFTDEPLVAGSTEEVRSALAGARSALGLGSSVLTDPALASGVTAVKAAHVEELRAAVK